MRKKIIAFILAGLVLGGGFYALNAKASDLKYNYGAKNEKKQETKVEKNQGMKAEKNTKQGVISNDVRKDSGKLDSTQLQVTATKELQFQSGEWACIYGWYDNDSIIYSDRYDSRNVKIRNLVTGKEKFFDIPGKILDYKNKKLILELEQGSGVYNLETKELKQLNRSCMTLHKKFADDKGDYVISDNCDKYVLIDVATGKDMELNYRIIDNSNMAAGDETPDILFSSDGKTVYYTLNDAVMKCSINDTKSASKVVDFSSEDMHKEFLKNSLRISKTADDNVIIAHTLGADKKFYTKTVNLTTGAVNDIQGMPRDSYILNDYISSNAASKVTRVIYQSNTKTGMDICCGELKDGKIYKNNVIVKDALKDLEYGGWFGIWNPDSSRIFVRITPGREQPIKDLCINISR